MTAILVAAAVGLLLALLGTPLLIRFLHRREYGQFIRQDGPQGHFTKRGTPTMGGLVIILATVLGYGAANLIELRPPRASGVLLLFLIVGLGLIGFLDDFEKISKERSLGLRAWQKMLGQAFIGITFAVVALFFADRSGLTPASTRISFARDTNLDLAFAGTAVGLILFILWANFLITAWSNAVNLTDGLDGLAAGSSAMVFAAYTLIGVWQTNQSCQYRHHDVVATLCYQVRDPRDLAMIAAALLIAVLMEVVLGFLGYEPSTENYSSVPVSAVILYVIDRIRAAFLQQGFPEELVWRGWLFTSLGGTRAAGIVSVVFFTLMHLGSSGGQQNWIDHLIYLAWPFGFAVAAVVALWASGSTWAAVGVHVGAHMMWIVEMFMHVSLEQPVARLLEGALWLVVAAVIWLLARRGILRKAP